MDSEIVAAEIATLETGMVAIETLASEILGIEVVAHTTQRTGPKDSATISRAQIPKTMGITGKVRVRIRAVMMRSVARLHFVRLAVLILPVGKVLPFMKSDEQKCREARATKQRIEALKGEMFVARIAEKNEVKIEGKIGVMCDDTVTVPSLAPSLAKILEINV